MPELQPVTILHVEDNEANRYIVTRMLQNAGYKVTEATTGTEGLELATALQPDLIILDVQLPDINGFEVCKRLKANPETAFIPVLHLSATLTKSQDRAQGLDGGADGYLAQPIEAIELIATVRALLRMRQAEEEVRAIATEWQVTFDTMNDGVCLLDSVGKMVRCNHAMSKFLGRSCGEMVGSQHQEFMRPLLGSTTDTPFLQVQTTGKRETAEVAFQGQWYVLTVDPIYAPQQVFKGAVYILANITDRRRAEASIQFLSEASAVLGATLDYKTTLKNLARLVVPMLAKFCFFDLVGENGKIQRVAWQHADTRQQEWVEQVQNYVPPPSCQNHPTNSVLASGKATLVPIVTDAWMQATSSSAAHLQFMRDLQLYSLISVPLIAHNRKLGVLTCCLGEESGRHYTHDDLRLLVDLADRAALALDNARLYREAQDSNRIKDEFLATLSHELRSPLNAMLGWAKLLKTRKFDAAMTAHAVDVIERNARSQAQLIEDLLDVSRIIQGKFRLDIRPVNLVSVVEAAIETVRPAAEAKEIRLDLLLDPTAGLVAGDPNRLQQVLWNLLSNAIKFTTKQGSVDVRLERIHSQVEIMISDTGQGISPEFLPYVFDRFRQADNSITRPVSGLGLGLAIVRHLVELHGGTVHADSQGKDQGATFTIKLPLLEQSTGRQGVGGSGEVFSSPFVPDPQRGPRVPQREPQVPRGGPESLCASLEGIQVLVVDDETDAREFVTTVLEQYGADVVAVASVAEALAAVSRSTDVLISDIGMPEEDGYSLIRKVRALVQDRQIPAIALTAYARAEERTRAIAVGFQMHLSKPVEPIELATVVASLAGRKLPHHSLE